MEVLKIINYTEHIKQARYNDSTLDFLIKNHQEAIDWIITITFYSALHYCSATLAKNYNLYPTQHSNPKNRKLGRIECIVDRLPIPISALYNSLRIESEKARYAKQGIYRENTTYSRMQKLIVKSQQEFPKLIS